MSRQNIPEHQCFVGNIPYDVTEEMLTQIFGAVGPVVHFRIVKDRETGQGKGFGFCEYHDAATALSAMRNLNGYEISGRTLRVDFASGTGKKSAHSKTNIDNDKEKELHQFTHQEKKAAADNAVENAVHSFPPHVLWDIMSQMKEMVQRNPDEARKLLTQYPQLTHGLLRCQLQLGMVNTPVPGVPPESMPINGGASAIATSSVGILPSQMVMAPQQYNMPPPQYVMPPPNLPIQNNSKFQSQEYEPPSLISTSIPASTATDPRRRRR